MSDQALGTTPVTDRRTPPRGVLPRGAQTWLMLVVALGILTIILFTGRPEPRPEPGAGRPEMALDAGRLRDYQDRLRLLDERARQQQQERQRADTRPDRATRTQETGSPAPADPIDAERRRREYESLFAANVVLTRRVAREPLTEAQAAGVPATGPQSGAPATPTLDDIADAVVRASARQTPSSAGGTTRSGESAGPSGHARAPEQPAVADHRASGAPHYRLLEGTLIEAVLTNRLDGSSAAPVNALVTTPVYAHDGRHVLIPAGARVLGTTKPVQAFGDTRLAVAFHRVIQPDGRTHSLEQFVALNQVGDAGLRDRVNHHYWSTFGASAAIGLVGGLAQYAGTAGLNGSGDRTIVIAGGAADATAQTTSQVMNRFLNRLPTVTIREGHRLNVYLTSDLELPAYESSSTTPASMSAR